MSRFSKPPLLLSNLLACDSRTASANSVDWDVSKKAGNGYVVLASDAGSGGTTTLDVVLQNSAPQATFASYTTDGATDTELKVGASDNVELGAKWTQSGNRSIKSVILPLKTNGAPSGAATITCKIYDDSSGPNSAVATSSTVLVSAIGSTYGPIEFTFATPIDLTDTSVYYVAIAASYSASGDNNIMWRTGTVGSGGNAWILDAAWGAVATSNFEFIAKGYNWSSVTGGTFSQVTTTQSTTLKTINMDALEVIRVKATQGAGSTFVYGVTALFEDENGATS